MSPFRSAIAPRAVAVLTAAVLIVPAAPDAAAAAPAPPSAPAPSPAPLEVPVEQARVLPVEDIIPVVESLDGTESESQRGDEVTVALTSDVLFALDKATLGAKARQRLRTIARKVRADGAGGVVRVEGHTDDQGAPSYNLRLSLRRAQAVQRELTGLLRGMTLRSKGFGEARPKLPNSVRGKPVEENRERNRRVEIIFTTK